MTNPAPERAAFQPKHRRQCRRSRLGYGDVTSLTDGLFLASPDTREDGCPVSRIGPCYVSCVLLPFDVSIPPTRSRRAGVVTLVTPVLACIFFATLTGCRGGSDTTLEALTEARRLASDARVQLNKADDATNRSVMADTDAASVAFAREARETTTRVEADAARLHPLLQSLGYAEEARALETFDAALKNYLDLDTRVLALAVENTNLKAQTLSFGPVREAADRFKDALQRLTDRVAAGSRRCQAEALQARASLAIREIQVLQAPHIAEPDDAAMARLEAQMATLDATAHQAASALVNLVGANGRELGASALAELERFKALSAELVALSRRNTNVRSLSMSLREKPPLTRACDDAIGALQDALAKRGLNATR